MIKRHHASVIQLCHVGFTIFPFFLGFQFLLTRCRPCVRLTFKGYSCILSFLLTKNCLQAFIKIQNVLERLTLRQMGF